MLLKGIRLKRAISRSWLNSMTFQSLKFKNCQVIKQVSVCKKEELKAKFSSNNASHKLRTSLQDHLKTRMLYLNH